MKNDIIPTRYSNFFTLETNFIKKYREYAESLGISKAEIDKTIEIISTHMESYTNMNQKRNESKSATEEHILRNRTAVKELRRVTKLIKSLNGYTDAIGDALGIIGTQSTDKSESELKPVLHTYLSANQINIKYKKQKTDGIMLFSKRGEEKEFSLLGYSVLSPYVDTREKLDPTKPEYREYYAFFVKKYKEVGVKSNIVHEIVH